MSSTVELILCHGMAASSHCVERLLPSLTTSCRLLVMRSRLNIMPCIIVLEIGFLWREMISQSFDFAWISVRLNLSHFVLTLLVFSIPAVVDHYFLVSIFLLRGSPLAAWNAIIDSLAPVLIRALTNLLLVCLLFLPVGIPPPVTNGLIRGHQLRKTIEKHVHFETSDKSCILMIGSFVVTFLCIVLKFRRTSGCPPKLQNDILGDVSGLNQS